LSFCSSYNVPDSGVNEHLPTNIFNSGVDKYCTNLKSTIFLTLAPVNTFARFGFLIEEETIFLMPFSFCLPFLFTFLKQKEKKHYIKDSHLIVMVCRLNMQHRKTIRQEKK